MALGGMASRAARRTVSSKLHTSLYAVQDAGCMRRRDGAHAKPIVGQPGGIAMRFEMRLMSTAVTMLLAAASLGASVSLAQAQKEKIKVKLGGGEVGEEQNIKLLPERLRRLIERSRVLLASVRRLDATMHASADPARARPANPVERQLGLLKAAFERE